MSVLFTTPPNAVAAYKEPSEPGNQVIKRGKDRFRCPAGASVHTLIDRTEVDIVNSVCGQRIWDQCSYRAGWSAALEAPGKSAIGGLIDCGSARGERCRTKSRTGGDALGEGQRIRECLCSPDFWRAGRRKLGFRFRRSRTNWTAGRHLASFWTQFSGRLEKGRGCGVGICEIAPGRSAGI